MFTQYTSNDLAGELHRRLDTMEDYLADTRRMGFYVARPDGADDDYDGPNIAALHIDGVDDNDGMFPVNDHAQTQVATKLGIPRKYWDRMRDDHPDILQDTVGKLFVREPSHRLVRTLDGQARAFLSNRYRRLDNYDLMDRAVLPALGELGDQMHIVSLGLTDLRLYVKFVFPDVTVDLGGGDTLSAGLAIGNSEVGAGSLSVEPFLYRSFCTNGLIMGVRSFADFGLRKQHVGRVIDDGDAARTIFTDDTLRKDDDAFFSAVHDLVSHAASGIQFEAIVSRVRDASGHRLGGDPVKVVEQLGKAHGITEDERGSVMRHLIEGGDLSAWGYINAVTRTAEDAASYDRATDLERVGGELLDMPDKRWDAIVAAAAVAA